MKKARFLWITDSWPSLDHAKDTSLRLAQEAIRLGHESYWCSYRSISLEKGVVYVQAARILKVGPGRSREEFKLSPLKRVRADFFTSLQYRTDPPVDLHYLHPVQLLWLAGGKKPLNLVNPAPVLMMANEKLEAVRVMVGGKCLLPDQLVASDWETLLAFGRKLGRVVLKPLHLAQSRGIELLDFSTEAGLASARAHCEAATEGFIRPILLQQFLKGIQDGEVRLWYVDGKLLACVKKHPLQDDFRVNIDRGSRLAPHTLSAAEKKAALAIGKHLKKLRVRMAAVDLIDGFATDFNFTSPGLIVQMEQVLGRNLAEPIVRALAK